MSVRTLGNRFASELHATSLKARGYKKSGGTFTCERDDYVEMIQIQGSDWNSGEEPWLFYINVRVRFNNLPNSFASRGSKYDADGRLERIVVDAPSRFELTSENISDMVSYVADLTAQASAKLPELLVAIHGRASQGLFSPIPLANSWRESDK